ncbi:MAG TPA: SUMF1/EgtB/PvdO family nonheme iron enzyme [Candidatus Syntrophosphaera sp.]|nr:SUMF1/EgtB/PvdO family nonheme iron enzyme [Candidatus Syntrophosphaera sp.]
MKKSIMQIAWVVILTMISVSTLIGSDEIVKLYASDTDYECHYSAELPEYVAIEAQETALEEGYQSLCALLREDLDKLVKTMAEESALTDEDDLVVLGSAVEAVFDSLNTVYGTIPDSYRSGDISQDDWDSQYRSKLQWQRTYMSGEIALGVTSNNSLGIDLKIRFPKLGIRKIIYTKLSADPGLAQKLDASPTYKAIAVEVQNLLNEEAMKEEKIAQMFAELELAKMEAVNEDMTPEGFVFVRGMILKLKPGQVTSSLPETTRFVSSFYIGRHEITQKEWMLVMGINPSEWIGDDLPVENVSWYDAVEYCNQRSINEGLQPCYSGSAENISCDWTANGYRLPTVTEWQHAASGGILGRGHKFSGSDTADEVSWHFGNSEARTHAVGGKQANELGLHDMNGNVAEWGWNARNDQLTWPDTWGDSTAESSPAEMKRAQLGSSWKNPAENSDIGTVFWRSPEEKWGHLGFRLVRAN